VRALRRRERAVVTGGMMSERVREESRGGDMIDPRLEPNFGFDFLDQNRLDSVEFDSQGRVGE
jgi:hypothetical protein